jgi:CheY-like chemotaxis protein
LLPVQQIPERHSEAIGQKSSKGGKREKKNFLRKKYHQKPRHGTFFERIPGREDEILCLVSNCFTFKHKTMDLFKKFLTSKPQPVKKLFIVEDNPAYAKFLQNFLKARFSEITDSKIFPVGETCVMELYKNPDLIIVDYYLDSRYNDAGNGVDAIREIRRQKPKTPIILLSAKSNADSLAEAARKFKCYFIKKDEHTFYKVEAIIKNLSKRKYFISPDIITSVFSVASFRKGLSRLSGKAFAIFE